MDPIPVPTSQKLYRLAIDRVTGRFVRGWCFHRLFKRRPVRLWISADGEDLGSVRCRNYRRDLFEAGLHPTGHCGFDFDFPGSFDPTRCRRLELRAGRRRLRLASIDCTELELLKPRISRPVFFMHLPKTAGSSFNAFARQCFPADRMVTHLERLDPRQRRQARLRCDYLSGHIPWRELVELIEPAEYELYTIIREPFAQLHSHLNYFRRMHAESDHEGRRSYQLNTTIKELARRLYFQDFSTVEAVRDLVEGLSGFERDFFDNMQTRFLLGYRPEVVTEDDFEAAAAVARQFRAIGLTERYDRFRMEFCRDLGLDPQPQQERANTSDGYRLFDLEQSEIKATVEPLVRYDLRLYQWALSLQR